MKGPAAFSTILESEGFQAIATAIRSSTIIPQYMKAVSKMEKDRGPDEKKPTYEIHYGLGQELKRKAAYKDEFLIALCDFLQSYNQENAQKHELYAKAGLKKPQTRKNICTVDIDDIVRLVDQFGSELVGSLLIAYGYARDPKEQPEPQAEVNNNSEH